MWREVCVCSRVVFLHHRSIEGKKSVLVTQRLSSDTQLLSQKLHLVYSVYVDFTRRCHPFVVSCLICSFAPNLEAFRQTDKRQSKKYSHYLTCFSDVDVRS